MPWFDAFYYSKKRKREDSKEFEEWKKIVTEMGLEESKKRDTYGNINPQITGDYRNHHLRIDEYEMGGEYSSSLTHYNVEFENPQTILMSIGKRSIFFPILTYPPYLWKGKNIRMNDSEFDDKFFVRGNKESEVRAILDSSIRSKIRNIRDFNIIIELHKIKNFNKLINLAQHVDFHSLSKTKQGAERFKEIIDTVIDIVEKIEAYTPSS